MLTAGPCLFHACVQMTNPVSLLLASSAPGAVSQLVISLVRRYAQYINKTYRRIGTLWDSRCKSSLGQADPLRTPHPLYLALGATGPERLAAYRALFHPERDGDAIGDIRMAMDQGRRRAFPLPRRH